MTTAPYTINREALEALPAHERAEELAKIQELDRLARTNPLYRYVPHGGVLEWKMQHGVPLRGDETAGQWEFHQKFDLRHVAVVAGNRFGKTTVGLEDALIQTLPYSMVPEWFHPYKKLDPEKRDVRMRFVGSGLGNWLAKAVIPKLQTIIPPQALWRGSFGSAWSEKNRMLKFADGSWWDFLTHDMDVDAFASTDVDRVTWDEEPEGEQGELQYSESITRLVDREGDMRYTLTPLLGLTWLYERLTDEHGDPRRDDTTWVIDGSIDHNPHISDVGRQIAFEEWERKPLELAARRHGRWVHFEGAIYSEFREDVHVIPDEPIPRAETPDGRPGELLAIPYGSIDPGINEDHQMALVLGYLWMDGDEDVLDIFHVHKFADGTIEDMAKHYHEVCATLGIRLRWTVIDPSAKNRNPQTGRSSQFVFQRHGINTIPGQNAVQPGINAVKERLRARTKKSGIPRLRVHASCRDLVDEIKEYRWKKRRGHSDDAPKAKPVKRKDDLLDALRYLVMSMPSAPRLRKPIPENESTGQRLVRENHEQLAKRGRRSRSRARRQIGHNTAARW